MTVTNDHTVDDTAAELSGTVRSAIADIWCDVLDIDEIEPDDDFFAIGGHSLLAIRVRARIDRRFGVAVELADLFEHATLTELTELVLTELCAHAP